MWGSALRLCGACSQFLILQKMVTKGSLLLSGCEVSSYLGSCLMRTVSHDPSSSLSLESVTLRGSCVLLVTSRPAKVAEAHPASFEAENTSCWGHRVSCIPLTLCCCSVCAWCTQTALSTLTLTASRQAGIWDLQGPHFLRAFGCWGPTFSP